MFGNDVRRPRQMRFATALILLSLPATASSSPPIELESILHGDAFIDFGPGSATISVSELAILDFLRFGIPDGYVVRFIQPGASSRVLNRVLGDEPTRIDGSLLANGQVYLINPAGVIFGQGAVVDTAEFHAAAATMSNADFLAGIDRFVTSGAPVINHGMIGGEDAVHLVGHRIENHGIIMTDRGLITLTSGEEVLIGEIGSSIFVEADGLHSTTGHAELSPGMVADEVGVLNTGTVVGDDVVFAAGDVYSLAIRNEGVVRAEGGDITLAGNGLVVNAGVLDASDDDDSAHGGRVRMLGEHVGVLGGTIDASGGAGGGTILIGGDLSGEGPHRNAAGTFISADSAIHADALHDGHGGEIIVWADDATQVHGLLSARGGPEGGNGGFVETSGKHYLGVTRAPDVSAPNGSGGLWLLDPSNVIIQNGAGNLDGLSPVFVAIADDSTISAAVILAALNAGISVTISTGNAFGGQDGNITIEADVDLIKTAGGNALLTLLAANDIIVNGTIGSTAGELSLLFVANDIAQVLHDLDAAAGDVIINGLIETNGGTFTATGVNFQNLAEIVTDDGLLTITCTGDITLDAAIRSGNGSIAIQALGIGSQLNLNSIVEGGTGLISLDALGDVNLGAACDISSTSGLINLGAILAGGVNLGGTISSVTGDITFSNAVTLLNNCLIDTSAGNADVIFDSTVDGASILTIDAGLGAIELNADVGTSTALAEIDLTAGMITVDGDVLTTGDQTYTGDITLAAVTIDSTTNGSLLFDGDVTLTGDALLSTAGGATDDVTFNGTIDGASILTVNAGLGDIALNADVGSSAALAKIDLTAGAIAVNADVLTTGDQCYTGDTTLDDCLLDSTTAGVLLFDGDVTLAGDALLTTAGGATDDVTFNGTIDGASILTVDAGLGDIALNADVGSSAALAKIDLTAGAIAVNADVITTGDQCYTGDTTLDDCLLDSTTAGVLLFDGDVTLAGDALLTTAGGATDDVTFNGTIDGASILTVDAGLGDIALTADVGSTVALAEIDLTAGAIDVDGDILTTGDQTYTGDVTLAAVTIDSSTAGSLLFDGDVTLTADALFTTAGGATDDVTFNGTIDGASILTVDAGLGDIAFGADVGSTVALAEVDLTAGMINVDGDMLTTGDQTYTGDVTLVAVTIDSATAGSLLFDGDVTLDGNAVLTTAGGATDDVTFNGTIDGASILTVNAGLGDIALTADVGSTVALAEIDLTAGAIDVDGDVLTTGDQTYTGDVTLAAVTIDSSTAGSLLFDGDVTLTADALFTTAGGATDDVTFNGTIDGASILTVDAGLGDIAFGADVGSTVALAEVDLTAGMIDVDGDILTTGDQTYTGDVTLAAVTIDSATAGSLLFDGDVTLDGDAVLTTAGGATDDVTFNGTIDGASILTVNAGLGDIALNADVGSSSALAKVDLTAGVIAVSADVLTTGDQCYTGDMTFDGSSITTLTDGEVILDGDVTLLGDLDVQTAGGAGDDVTITGDLDGAFALSLDAGASGVITLDGDLGSMAALDDLALQGDDITVNGSLDVNGDLDVTANELDLLGGDDSVTVTGAITIAALANGTSIDVGSPVGGTGDFDLSDADLDAIAAGTSGVTIESDLIVIGSLALTDPFAAVATGGTISVTDDITSSGSGAVSLESSSILLGGDITTAGGDILLDGAIDLTAAVELDSTNGGAVAAGADIDIDGTIDGGADLTLDAGTQGDITLTGAIGATTALDDLLIDSAADVSITGDVTVGSLTQSAGTGDTTIDGDITTSGGTGEAGGDVTIDIDGDIEVDGTIDTSGGGAGGGGDGQDGGDVILVSEDGSIIVGAIDTSGTDATSGSGGDGGNAGNIVLQASTDLINGGAGDGDWRPVGLVEINGDLVALAGAGDGSGSDGAGGNVSINALGFAEIPSVATVIGHGGLSIDASGDILFGTHQKLSADGDIELLSDDGTITIGDLTSSGDVTLDAGDGDIVVRLRADGSVLLADGTLVEDDGTDWVVGGSIDVSATPTFTGGASDDQLTIGITDLDLIDPLLLGQSIIEIFLMVTVPPFIAPPVRDGFAGGLNFGFIDGGARLTALSEVTFARLLAAGRDDFISAARSYDADPSVPRGAGLIIDHHAATSVESDDESTTADSSTEEIAEGASATGDVVANEDPTEEDF